MVELNVTRKRVEGNPRVQYMSYMSKFVAALIVLLLMTIVASRQLFLFADPAGLSAAAERSHLWLAAIAGITACGAGVFMSYFFNRHEKNRWSKVGMTLTGPLDIVSLNASNVLAPVPFNAARWAVSNPWLVEGQPDDRTPMDGSVRDIGGTPSEQRSFTRRTHQLMFKKWSQARHD
jgi:hypothetical protein